MTAPVEDKKQDTVKDAPVKKKKRKKKTARDYMIELIIKVAVTAIVIIILLTLVIGIHVNHGNSSYPMIKDGDLVITYRIGEPVEGDAVIYRQDGQVRTGRIAACAGDVVEISGGCVKVNGYLISDGSVFDTPEGDGITFPYTAPQHSVFILNDFREDLNDSRKAGATDLDDVEGKIIFVIRRRGI